MGKLSDLHKFPQLVSDIHLLKIQRKTSMDTESLLFYFLKDLFIKIQLIQNILVSSVHRSYSCAPKEEITMMTATAI